MFSSTTRAPHPCSCFQGLIIWSMEIDPVVKYTSPFLRLFCYIKIQVKFINKLHHVLKHACNYIQSLGLMTDFLGPSCRPKSMRRGPRCLRLLCGNGSQFPSSLDVKGVCLCLHRNAHVLYIQIDIKDHKRQTNTLEQCNGIWVHKHKYLVHIYTLYLHAFIQIYST